MKPILAAIVAGLMIAFAATIICDRTTEEEKSQHERAVKEIVRQAPDVLSAAQFSIRAYQGHTSNCVLFLVHDYRGELYQACLVMMTADKEVLLAELKKI